MIEPCGRLDVPGRPILYRTTDDFLRVFGLNSLSDLPEVKTRAPLHEGDVFPIENLETTVPTDISSGRVSSEDEKRSDAEAVSDEAASENSED